MADKQDHTVRDTEWSLTRNCSQYRKARRGLEKPRLALARRALCSVSEVRQNFE